MSHHGNAAFYTVCRVEDLGDGEAGMFIVEGQRIGVFHVGGRFYALEDSCPHAGASLAHGIVEGETVTCRIHYWRFSIPRGTYLDENKPHCNVRTFPVRIVDGAVQVRIADPPCP